MSRLRMAADVGGSFTDLVVDDGAALRAFKAPTTPADPTLGVLEAVSVAARAGGETVAELLGRTDVFVHGTTRALNAVLTGQTARTALLTTAGHPDVLLFREGGRSGPFDLSVEYPRPLVPRALTFEVPERILSDGSVRRPLDEDAVLEVIGRLRDAAVEAVAVCLLWSVVEGRHERRVGELLDEHLPGVPYTLSHVLNPTLREYRRACSTALNASLLSLMGAYLEHLGGRLRASGLDGRLMVMSSSGGTLHAPDAARAPIHALNSGPATAPAAARAIAAAEAGTPTAVVFDSGGTTCDVSVIRDGAILATRETWVGPLGAGHITGFPSVDVRSIAAGGGSIASVDAEGLLHVGPRSAGAEPGPACYGRGGTEPTVTDACLVAGYLDPGTFLDGALELDRARAEAVLAPLAAALGVATVAAAEAVIELATDHLVSAIEQITLGKGVDPRATPLVGGGGAAGLNIVAIARRLGAPLAIVPAYGATLSAAGALVTPLTEEHAVTAPAASDRFDAATAREAAAELRRRCEAFHAANAAVASESWIEHSVEARYRHQVWDLVVDHPPLGDAGPEQLADLVERFHAAHARAYGVDDRGGAVEFLTWRARACCAPLGRQGTFQPAGSALGAAGRRRVSFPGAGLLDTAVVGSETLTEPLAGPAIVEARSTSVVIPPGATVRRSPAGHLLIHPGEDP